MAKQRYSAVIMHSQSGNYAAPVGGLGGASGTGDYSYGRSFFMNKATLNIPHVGATQKEGKYPHPERQKFDLGFDFDKYVYGNNRTSSAVHFSDCKNPGCWWSSATRRWLPVYQARPDAKWGGRPGFPSQLGYVFWL